MGKKYNKIDFIELAIKKHGEKYHYELVEYIGHKIPVKIFCKKCEEFFLQKPSIHLRGCGCTKCGINKSADDRRKNKNDFVGRATKIHDNKYDYSLVIYINNCIKVDIICPIHGIFKQSPISHLKGQTCKKCAFDIRKIKYDEFIKRAKVVHNEKYNYLILENFDYQNKIEINCPLHGNFIQRPMNHLKGQNCPKCKVNVQENKLYKFIINKLPNVNIVQQFKPTWLKCYKGNQSFDIYLSDYNIAIEYQGLQHFKSIDYWSGEEGFVKQIERDERKRKLCEENDVKLFYFTYEKNHVPENFKFKVFTSQRELINVIKKIISTI